MTSTSHLAVDLGASSGRVILGTLDGDDLRVDVVRRFPTRVLDLPDGLHWDVGHLFHETLAGMADATTAGAEPASIAFDTWGVDYAFVSDTGTVLGAPFSYRDARTRGLTERLDDGALYSETGIQTQEINTLVQLLAEPRDGAITAARTLLFMPDLLAFLLTGARATDRTIASTSQLLRYDGVPARTVNARYGVPDLLPVVLPNGSTLGGVRDAVVARTGFRGDTIVAAGHDTACAVAAIPATDEQFAFISCGTWALVGFELDAPRRSSAARQAGFTNEHGIDGTYRFLRNVTGMWLLNECLRSWGLDVSSKTASELIDAAVELPRYVSIIDPLDAAFIPPGDMPRRIAQYCADTGQRAPETRVEFARCIVDSLALSFADTIAIGARLADLQPRVIHMVGGGSAIADLCRAVADLTGLEVVAGPVEATGLGNILIQARAHGTVDSLAHLREIVRSSAHCVRYEPRDGVARSAVLDAFRGFAASRATHDS